MHRFAIDVRALPLLISLGLVACAERSIGLDDDFQDEHTLGLWHMDDPGSPVSRLIDSSDMGNDLVRADTSDSVTGHEGRFGSAVGVWPHVTNAEFSSGTYFANTSLVGGSALSELTFEFWLRIRPGGVVNDPNPFGFGDDDNDCFRIDDGNALEYRNHALGAEPIATEVLPLGSWNHIALTWDTSFARIWINGDLAVEQNSSGPSPITQLRVGAGCMNNANLSSAAVDEVRLSDTIRYWEPCDPPQAPFCVMSADCNGGVCVDGGVCSGVGG
jgi:hypothetical protein